MAKKQSKPFTEEDLAKMGLKETAPNFYEKAVNEGIRRVAADTKKMLEEHDKAVVDSLKRMQDTKPIPMGGIFNYMRPYDATPPRPSADIFYFIGDKYKFKPKLFIAVPPCSAPRMTR